MADPTLGLTFSDLILRTAEFLGIADYSGGTAAVPTDAHDLDVCKRVVNDAYRRFITESPKWRFMTVPFTIHFTTSYTGTAASGSTTTLVDTGRTEATSFFNGFQLTVTHGPNSTNNGAIEVYNVTTWNLATHTFTVAGVTGTEVAIAAGDTYETAATQTVEGQNWRYFLPDDFYGVLLQPFTYNVGGPRIQINPVDEHRIRELRVGANTSGTPSVVATRAINTTAASTGKRWEAMFWPRPTGTESVTTVYKRFPQKLVNLTDRSVAGYQHDDTIVKACFAEAELQRNDTYNGPREQAYQSALARSMKNDDRTAPVRGSDYGDRSEDRAVGGRRPLNYYGVSTHNGADISGF